MSDDTYLKLTDKETKLHDRLYAEGWALIQDKIELHGRSLLHEPDRRKMKKAISLFEQTLELNPRNWSCMWALGKIHQRLNDDSTALGWFSEARKVEPNNPDILREAALCAMKSGNGRVAVELATSAIKLQPNDAGLVSNLALALLLDGRTEEAKEQAVNAVRANPDGRVARSVLQLIEDVGSGKTPRPTTLS